MKDLSKREKNFFWYKTRAQKKRKICGKQQNKINFFCIFNKPLRNREKRKFVEFDSNFFLVFFAKLVVDQLKNDFNHNAEVPKKKIQRKNNANKQCQIDQIITYSQWHCLEYCLAFFVPRMHAFNNLQIKTFGVSLNFVFFVLGKKKKEGKQRPK